MVWTSAIARRVSILSLFFAFVSSFICFASSFICPGVLKAFKASSLSCSVALSSSVGSSSGTAMAVSLCSAVSVSPLSSSSSSSSSSFSFLIFFLGSGGIPPGRRRSSLMISCLRLRRCLRRFSFLRSVISPNKSCCILRLPFSGNTLPTRFLLNSKVFLLLASRMAAMRSSSAAIFSSSPSTNNRWCILRRSLSISLSSSARRSNLRNSLLSLCNSGASEPNNARSSASNSSSSGKSAISSFSRLSPYIGAPGP